MQFDLEPQTSSSCTQICLHPSKCRAKEMSMWCQYPRSSRRGGCHIVSNTPSRTSSLSTNSRIWFGSRGLMLSQRIARHAQHRYRRDKIQIRHRDQWRSAWRLSLTRSAQTEPCSIWLVGSETTCIFHWECRSYKLLRENHSYHLWPSKKGDATEIAW